MSLMVRLFAIYFYKIFQPFLSAGPNAGDITGGVSSGNRGGCEGFAELKAEETTLFKINKAPHEDENSKMSKITLEQSVRSIARRSAKTLNVQGNCCWQFHEG